MPVCLVTGCTASMYCAFHVPNNLPFCHAMPSCLPAMYACLYSAWDSVYSLVMCFTAVARDPKSTLCPSLPYQRGKCSSDGSVLALLKNCFYYVVLPCSPLYCSWCLLFSDLLWFPVCSSIHAHTEIRSTTTSHHPTYHPSMRPDLAARAKPGLTLAALKHALYYSS